MKSIDGMRVGWIDTSIGQLIRNEDAPILSRFAYVLLTCVDSATDVAETVIGKHIASRDLACPFLGKGLLVPSTNLVAALREVDLFSGFDEIWCFDEKPMREKPADLWIIAPLNIEEAQPASLLNWMTTSNCRLGLGDGIGLNYVTPDEDLADLLERSAAT